MQTDEEIGKVAAAVPVIICILSCLGFRVCFDFCIKVWIFLCVCLCVCEINLL